MIEFGIPKREVKEEKYADIPVLTMEAVKEEKGSNRRFILNQKAIELLDVIPGISKVTFAFDTEDKKAYITKMDGEDSIMVNKNKAFSNKKYYEYVSKVMNTVETNTNYFELKDGVDIAGTVVYDLVYIEPVAEIVETVYPIIEKEIEPIPDPEVVLVDTDSTTREDEPHGW